MSKNIDQVFIANPITSNASTDLMYFGQSPYGVGNDAAMLYSNFKAQFTLNVLTTKGDLLSYDTAPDRLAVGSTNGQVLQVNSGAAIGLSWSTATYPTTTTINQILYSSSANTVAGITTANNGALITSAGGVPSISSTLPSAVQTNITALGTQSQALNMGTHQINSVTDPTSPQDVATKNYVDTYVQGLNPVSGVAAATTGNLNATYSNGVSGVGATLTNAGANAAFSTDGYSASLNDRILVWQQSTAFQNGIYTVTTVGSGSVPWVLTRAADYDTTLEIAPGDLVSVENGTTYATASFIQTATVVTIGVSSITFSIFFSPNTYTGSTSITTLGTITTGTWHGSIITGTYGGTGVNNGTNTATFAGNLNFANSFTTSGNFPVTQTYTGSTNVTFPTSGTLLNNTLTSANIYVGNGSNVATGVSMSGDATLANTGAITFATVNSNVGTFGSATQVSQFTVNGKGLITAASNVSITGTITNVNQNTSSATLAASSRYSTNNGASLVTYTIPAGAAVGDTYIIVGGSSGGWTVAQPASVQCHLGSSATTSGATGTISSTNQYDCCSITCVASNVFTVYGVQGNLTIV